MVNGRIGVLEGDCMSKLLVKHSHTMPSESGTKIRRGDKHEFLQFAANEGGATEINHGNRIEDMADKVGGKIIKARAPFRIRVLW